jgi:hypothetical protein
MIQKISQRKIKLLTVILAIQPIKIEVVRRKETRNKKQEAREKETETGEKRKATLTYLTTYLIPFLL